MNTTSAKNCPVFIVWLSPGMFTASEFRRVLKCSSFVVVVLSVIKRGIMLRRTVSRLFCCKSILKEHL